MPGGGRLCGRPRGLPAASKRPARGRVGVLPAVPPAPRGRAAPAQLVAGLPVRAADGVHRHGPLDAGRSPGGHRPLLAGVPDWNPRAEPGLGSQLHAEGVHQAPCAQRAGRAEEGGQGGDVLGGPRRGRPACARGLRRGVAAGERMQQDPGGVGEDPRQVRRDQGLVRAARVQEGAARDARGDPPAPPQLPELARPQRAGPRGGAHGGVLEVEGVQRSDEVPPDAEHAVSSRGGPQAAHHQGDLANYAPSVIALRHGAGEAPDGEWLGNLEG
mmetsp:Transcript_90573/g.282019  ORF Transcript_90573/g.282019 Transcript_90573/m.282019 type:complete len:272 (+) Transcript_90573:529-1344(+)